MNTVTVMVPLTIRRRGGRKMVVAPEGAAWAPPRTQVDSTLVKALARAFRWRRMLEDGRYASIAELARAEKINESYVCRVLRLTLLAPDIVEAILDGRQPEVMLPKLMGPLPVGWERQRAEMVMPGRDSQDRPTCVCGHYGHKCDVSFLRAGHANAISQRRKI
jgi:hypothetical protein